MGGNFTQINTDALFETSRGVALYKCCGLPNLITYAFAALSWVTVTEFLKFCMPFL